MTPERPAHVAHAHEIRRRHAIGRADFHAKQRGLAAETHRADAEFVRRFQNVLLQRVELWLRITVVEPAEKLRLAQLIAGRAVAADTHTENARPAAFALCLQHRVENRLSATIQVAIGVELFVGQRILPADVFAPTAFEDQTDDNPRRGMLMEMNDRRTRPQVGAVVPAGEGIHGVLPEVALLGGQFTASRAVSANVI